MRERPILFTGPMVRAILAGTKTQTRRIVKPHMVGEDHHPPHGPVLWVHEEYSVPIDSVEAPSACPYGQPGDRLWVKETVSESEPCFLGGRPQPTVWYRADNNRPTWAERKWTPSIHCKRTLSRITLEITAVRVERLLAITEDDAIAEGCARNPDNRPPLPIPQFMDLWHRINGVESWNADPWVWVIEFRRVAP